MFNLILVNLTPDARAVSPHAHLELRHVTPDALRRLLEGFCEIDPIENAAGDTEIRVQGQNGKFLLRTELKKVILYDVNQRDLPGQRLTVGEALLELDGTAAAARRDAVMQARADTTLPPFAIDPALPAAPPVPPASKPRIIALAIAALVLVAAIAWLAAPWKRLGGTLPDFAPADTGQLDRLHASLAGVYLTGSEAGQHGIVITGPGEMKLVELVAVEAPRVVYAAYRLVGRGSQLLTDQPGGVIEIQADGSLVYCGETYRRIP